MGISTIDWGIVVAYFLGMILIGIWSNRKIKNTDDFYMGGRRFGSVYTVLHAFGAGTHTDMPVAVAGAAYEIGWAAIWYQWMWLFCTPFYWVISPIYRRMRHVTIADYFEERFGKSLEVTYAPFAALIIAVNIGMMLKGAGILVESMSDGQIPAWATIFFTAASIIVIGFAGGMVAAVVTDLVQGFMIIGMSILLIPFGLAAIGGFEGLHASLPSFMFSLVAPKEMTIWFLIASIGAGFVGIIAQPWHMEVNGIGKTEKECRMGWTMGNFIKRFMTIPWVMAGMIVAVMVPNLPDREMAFGVGTKLLLPIGFVGLMVACSVAALMSASGAIMVDGAALFNRNLYFKYVKKDVPMDKQLLVGRVVSVVIVILGTVIAMFAPSVVSILMLFWNLNPILGISAWLGIIWRRSNRYGAWASIIGSALTYIITSAVLHLSFPVQVVSYLTVGFGLGIIVSLLTPPENKEKLDSFYKRIQTPVTSRED